jgi:hypothetical protein
MIDAHIHNADMALKEPNTWTPKEAADWAGVNYRLLLDFFHRGLLPAIAVGAAQNQRMPSGRKRRRRVGKWVVPREAFVRAWQTFTVPRARARTKSAA